MDGRVLRAGTSVTLFPEEIAVWVAGIAPATSNQSLRTYIAKILAHEMGHALGVNLHSPDARDIMFGGISDWSRDAPPYPWITENDRNTIGEAYCK
jgi:predicted Zn-dependent protease